MKKSLFSIIIVLLYCPFAFAEYVVINRLVYKTYLKDLTATVLNYQTSIDVPCDVIIPETITYKNDIYTVTGLSNPFEDTLSIYGNEGSYSNQRLFFSHTPSYKYDYPYEYGKARANIEHIYLPNTLKHIEAGAFAGMDRLRSLVIPSSVQTFSNLGIKIGLGNFLSGGGLFSPSTTYYRLDSIIILGAPSCTVLEQGDDNKIGDVLSIIYGVDGIPVKKEHIELSLQDSVGEYIYLKEMARIVAGIDAKTGKSELCPNIKLFSMPKAERILAEKLKVQDFCNKSNDTLIKLRDSLNAQLREHPYFDDSSLSFDSISSDTILTIKIKYEQQKNSLLKQFKDLVNGEMKSNLKKNDSVKYLSVYRQQHTEVAHTIDSIYGEYCCYTESQQNKFVMQVLDGLTIDSKSCRCFLYEQHYALFNSKSEFDSIYNIFLRDTQLHKYVNINDPFYVEILRREEAYDILNELYSTLLKKPKVKLQGMKTAKKGVPHIIAAHLNTLKKTYFYDRAVKYIFDINKPINTEYLKNGQYFTNQQVFFEAYISSEYKKTLKANKKSK